MTGTKILKAENSKKKIFLSIQSGVFSDDFKNESARERLSGTISFSLSLKQYSTSRGEYFYFSKQTRLRNGNHVISADPTPKRTRGGRFDVK